MFYSSVLEEDQGRTVDELEHSKISSILPDLLVTLTVFVRIPFKYSGIRVLYYEVSVLPSSSGHVIRVDIRESASYLYLKWAQQSPVVQTLRTDQAPLWHTL